MSVSSHLNICVREKVRWLKLLFYYWIVFMHWNYWNPNKLYHTFPLMLKRYQPHIGMNVILLFGSIEKLNFWPRLCQFDEQIISSHTRSRWGPINMGTACKSRCWDLRITCWSSYFPMSHYVNKKFFNYIRCIWERGNQTARLNIQGFTRPRWSRGTEISWKG